MRVYEFSKQSGVSSKELLKLLKDSGFDVPSHMSVLTQEGLDFLQNVLNKNNSAFFPKQKEDKTNEQPKIQPKAEVQVDQKIKTEKKPQESKEKSDLEKSPTKNDEKQLMQQVPIINIKPMMLGDFAEAINKPATDVILTLLKKGIAYNKNQVLPENLVEQLAMQYGIEAIRPAVVDVSVKENIVVGKDLTQRLPVVVVIGHVDHGKTTLLDHIRKTRVASREKGGITQHLGAYEVKTKHGGVVFLDTPGHEAFSMMRGRGVRVADIAILVVAADDGVMPQTIEALKLAQSKNIPIIVALNKVDRVDNTRIDQVKTQLSKHGLMAEDWGGQTIVVPISAKLGQGIDQLLEMIILQSELMDLRADRSINACGFILESKIEKGLGAVATFIAQHGILKLGDFFICGDSFGKVTVLIDSNGARVNQSGPSMPVQIVGFEQLPQVGDFLQVVSEAEYRNTKSNKVEKRFQSVKVVPREATNIIIKTDNASSREAIINSVEQLAKKANQAIHILNSAIGNVSESDVLLASSVDAIIYGFNVKVDVNVMNVAQKHSIKIKNFDVIYHLFDDIKELLESKKEVEFKQVKSGEALIRKVFDIKGVGVIAGFYVKDGKIVKTGKISIFRNNKKIGEGQINTLQREKKSMKEIASGFEGALLIDGYTDWAIDDRIECFIEVPVV